MKKLSKNLNEVIQKINLFIKEDNELWNSCSIIMDFYTNSFVSEIRNTDSHKILNDNTFKIIALTNLLHNKTVSFQFYRKFINSGKDFIRNEKEEFLELHSESI